MSTYITFLHGLIGAALTAQEKTAAIGESLGFKRLAVERFPPDKDCADKKAALLDQIGSVISPGDVVIFQWPSWNYYSFDHALIDTVHRRGGKIILMVHDITALQFHSPRYSDLVMAIEIINRAELAILPTEQMRLFLRANGLNVKKTLLQTVWDYPYTAEESAAPFRRRIHFTGDLSRFPSVNKWSWSSELCLYSAPSDCALMPHAINYGFLGERDLLLHLRSGGFGLVWGGEEQFDYYRLNQPYKTAVYLAAGLPLIVQRGIALERFVLSHHLGYAADRLEEADRLVQSMTEQGYRRLTSSLAIVREQICQGAYTLRLLLDAMEELERED